MNMENLNIEQDGRTLEKQLDEIEEKARQLLTGDQLDSFLVRINDVRLALSTAAGVQQGEGNSLLSSNIERVNALKTALENFEKNQS